jgi:tetratricopeptide (TPR) repeat protein
VLEDLDEALRIGRREGDHVLTARALVALWTYESEVIGKDLEDDRLQEAMRLTDEHRLGSGLAAEVSYWRAWSCQKRGHVADAEHWLGLAVEHAAGHPRCPYGAMACQMLGEIALAERDLEAARVHLERALFMQQCDDIPRVAGMVWESLARLEHAVGRSREGDGTVIRYLQLAEVALSSTGDDTAAIRVISQQLALLADDGRLAALQRASSIIEAIVHSRLRATSLCALGFALAEMGEAVLAAGYARNARALLTAGDLTDDDLGVMAHEQGRLWLRLGIAEEAVAAYRIAVAHRRLAVAQTGDLPSARHAALAESLGQLGDALRDAGHGEAALHACRQSWKIVMTLPRTWAAQQGLGLWKAIGELHDAANRPAEARDAHLTAARMCAQLIDGGTGQGRRGGLLHARRAQALRAAGRSEEALAAYCEAAACLEALPVRPAEELARLHREQADLRAAMARVREEGGPV